MKLKLGKAVDSITAQYNNTIICNILTKVHKKQFAFNI